MTRSGNGHSSVSPPPSARGDSLKKLKVCHVVCTAEGGKWMMEQLRELRERYGHEVAAVVAGEKGRLVDTLRAEAIPFYVENFKFGSLRQTLNVPRTIYRLARLFRRERFDVVQTHLFFSMFVGRIAAWLADVPVRLAMLPGPFQLEAHTSRWIDRATCWMESSLIPSCEYTRQLYREIGVGTERLPLIYYGPDERRFDPEKTQPADTRASFGWPADTPLIVKVAYFYPPLPKSSWVPASVHNRPVKGHEYLIRAAPTILAEYPDAKILLVGTGWFDENRQMDEMKELVRSLGLEQSVIFTGYRADTNRILREADVAVQASLNDNLAGTIEALLMECPTVATRVGGMLDSVRDGETGVLVNPADPDDMARGIIEMLRDRERAHAFGRAGRSLMLERFSLSRTVKDLAELYQRLFYERERRRKSYNPLVSLWRLMAVVPVMAYLGFRYVFMDMLLSLYLPAYLARIRGALYRLKKLISPSGSNDRRSSARA